MAWSWANQPLLHPTSPPQRDRGEPVVLFALKTGDLFSLQLVMQGEAPVE